MSRNLLLGPTKKHRAAYDEGKMRVAALRWLREQYAEQEFLKPLFLFHDLGVSIQHYVRSTVPEEYWGKIPHWGQSAVRPDIVGLVRLPNSAIYGWIVAECKARTIEPSALRQAYGYAASTDAYAAYLFWDSKTGFTREAWNSADALGSYRAIGPDGKTTRKVLNMIMYDEPQDLFIEELQVAMVLRASFPTFRPLHNTEMPKFVSAATERGSR